MVRLDVCGSHGGIREWLEELTMGSAHVETTNLLAACEPRERAGVPTQSSVKASSPGCSFHPLGQSPAGFLPRREANQPDAPSSASHWRTLQRLLLLCPHVPPSLPRLAPPRPRAGGGGLGAGGGGVQADTPLTPRWDKCDSPQALLAVQGQREGQKTNGQTDKTLHQFTNTLTNYKKRIILSIA